MQGSGGSAGNPYLTPTQKSAFGLAGGGPLDAAAVLENEASAASVAAAA